MTSDAQTTHLQCSIFQHMTYVGTIQAAMSPWVISLLAPPNRLADVALAQPRIASKGLSLFNLLSTDRLPPCVDSRHRARRTSRTARASRHGY